MGVRLTEYERGDPFAGEGVREIGRLADELARLQLVQQVHGHKALICFEGWEGAGKKVALRTLTGAWDPCHFSTHCVRGGGLAHSRRHWLAPYWSSLPQPGETAIFFRSWYRSVVDARAVGGVDDKKWARSLDEINEFEAQQADSGTVLVKLFFHVSAEVQEERLRRRGEDPWLSQTVTPEDLLSHSAREGYLGAWHEMFEQTNTRWAPWHVIDAGDEQAARIAALGAVADAYAKALPSEPPARDETVVTLAQQKFG